MHVSFIQKKHSYFHLCIYLGTSSSHSSVSFTYIFFFILILKSVLYIVPSFVTEYFCQSFDNWFSEGDFLWEPSGKSSIFMFSVKSGKGILYEIIVIYITKLGTALQKM
jgi:hypothetical protein